MKRFQKLRHNSSYLECVYSRKYVLKSIIRVEEVMQRNTNIRRYFVDIEVADRKTNKTARIAEHILENPVDNTFCSPERNSWNPDAMIYVLLTVKNQGIWVRHFIDTIENIQEQTKDYNIHPIIVDFGSKDFPVNDTETYLQHSKLKQYSGNNISITLWSEGLLYKFSCFAPFYVSILSVFKSRKQWQLSTGFKCSLVDTPELIWQSRVRLT